MQFGAHHRDSSATSEKTGDWRLATGDSGALDLDHLPYDPELIPGARNAVETCLAIGPAELLTLVTDLASREIAASLLAAARQVGCQVRCFVLEAEAPRPLARCPESILVAAEESDAVIYCVQPQEGEIGSRSQLVELVETCRIRYAHMIFITEEIMRQGMRADYHAVDALSTRVLESVHTAERIVVKSRAGTHIEATFASEIPWIKTSGLISRDYWSNLPGGEVWTVPADLNGVFVTDGAVGDYLCSKYGDISATPLTLEIEGSRLREARSDNAALLADFLAYCGAAANGDRLGEFAFGTNIGVTGMIGNLLQDEKVPGIHIAFGNPCPNLTGVSWTSATHIDAISRNTDVWADGRPIMAEGRFLVQATER
ncbi:MAG: aminopeptidase [Chloroflexi bacterium]|nr:aminopeptidase [Chloroflexota bacterium]